MAIPHCVTKIIAAIIFLLKRRELKSPRLTFLVFTGTVGKTTLRDAVTFALKTVGYNVESNTLGYSNEVGILLTALGIAKFSAKNPVDWLRLLGTKNTQARFVCVELGADFYHDIPWFLKHFVPLAVFVSGTADKEWADKIERAFRDRVKLLESVPVDGFIMYNADDIPTRKIVRAASTPARKLGLSVKNRRTFAYVDRWSNHSATLPLKALLITNEVIEIVIDGESHTITINRPIFEPQLYGLLAGVGIAKLLHGKIPNTLFDNYQFAPRRLQFSKAKNGAVILEDSYKATPLCTSWLLQSAATVRASKKVLVVTEMRPLTINQPFFYEQLAKQAHFADSVYFLGPKEYWQMLHTVNQKVEYAEMADYQKIAAKIIEQTDENSLIVLKGSIRYRLDALAQLLT